MRTAQVVRTGSGPQPRVFGVEFTEFGPQRIADAVTGEPVPAGDGLRLMVTMNLDHAVNLRCNESFRRAYQSARLVTADGFPIYLYARWRGARLAGRVTGADLFPLIMERLSPERHRPFLMVSDSETREVLEKQLLRSGFQPGQYALTVPPHGFDVDRAASEALFERIEEMRPTHIFMGLGSPKSEIWLDRHRVRLGDAYAFAFGAGLNFFAGTARRAPKLGREAGFEGAGGFTHQPRRPF